MKLNFKWGKERRRCANKEASRLRLDARRPGGVARVAGWWPIPTVAGARLS